MRALVVTRHGGPEVLVWREMPEPVVAAGELLVRTRAVGLQWADLLEREGRYPGGPQPPFVGGHEVVGDIVAHGEGVSGPPLGTRVSGAVPRGGAAAELVAVPAHWMHIVPDGVGDEAAAGLIGPFLTADLAIVTFGRLVAGDAVVVHAAAGSFGSAAVQLCGAYGAVPIVATAGSDEKLARVRQWGAEVLVNYTRSDFVPAVMQATDGRGVDLVLESVGGDVLGRSFDCLRPGGRLISVGASSGHSSRRFRLQTLFEKGIVVGGFTLGVWLEHHSELVAPAADRVLGLVEEGRVAPVVGAVFAAGDAADAHRFLQNRRSIGRTVVSLTAGSA